MKMWKRYQEIINTNCIGPYGQVNGLPYWRNKLFATLLTYLVPLSLLAIIPGMIMSVISKMPNLAFFDFMEGLSITAIALYPGLSNLVRKSLFIGLLYAIAIILLYYLGSFGPGLLYLSAISTFAICISPQRFGWWSVVVNFVICLGFGIAISLELMANPASPAFSLGGWLTVSVNLMVLNVAIIALLPRLFYGLQETITNLKGAEEKNEFEQNNLNALINNTTDILYSVDRNLKLITANCGFDKMVRSITGKSIEKGEDMLTSGFDDEVLSRYRKSYARALNGETFTVTEHFEKPEEFWAETSFSPIRKGGEVIGIACFARNITARKKAELETKDAHDHLLFHLENSPLGYIEWDNQLRVKGMSKRTQEILGWTEEDFLNNQLGGINHIYEEDRSWVVTIAEQLLSGQIERNSVQHRVYTKDGRVIWCDWYNSIAKDSDGKVTTIMSLVKDITAKKETEVKLKELNENLEKRVEDRTRELNEANKALDSFSYSVSHDLRTPLRIIESFGDILIKDSNTHLNEQEKEMLKGIRSNTQHMNQMIDNLLNFSRLGSTAITRRGVNMDDVVNVVVNELKAADTNFNGEINMHHMNTGYCDAALIRQVWANLISNAMKYSGKKEKPVIEIGSQGLNGHSIYYVKDNGAGFDMQHAQKLFGVFQRLHKASEFEGTGVGLSLAERIVTKHGGKIWAEAKVNEGATFYFTLAK